jgi:predicted acetyltransferase
MIQIRIEQIPAGKKDVAWRYLQFYLYEHAAFTDKAPVDGVFEYPWFEAYWRDAAQRWPFWATVGGDVAALALVRRDIEDGHCQMAEFFVVNRYRGQGLAGRFAADIIRRFPGPWKIDQALRNTRATVFWRRVLADFGDYGETPLDKGDGVERIEQRFVV